VSLGEPLAGGAWSVRLYHKPFIDWIWGGCLIMAMGGVLAISDRRYRLAWRREESLPQATAHPMGQEVS
jgi:cytochrome c-type biogenesis protein CcmF